MSMNQTSLLIDAMQPIDVSSLDGYSNEQLLSFLRLTHGDILTQMKSQHDLPANDARLVRQYIKCRVVQVFLRIVMSAIGMAVMASAKRQQ
jgi:hypothetical protein